MEFHLTPLKYYQYLLIKGLNIVLLCSQDRHLKFFNFFVGFFISNSFLYKTIDFMG